MERIIGLKFQPLDCCQAMCTSMIVSITLVLIMVLNKFVPFFILLTMQCIPISWMVINMQTNHMNCGLYAIAYAIDLCRDEDVHVL